jgi:TPR repeat protein
LLKYLRRCVCGLLLAAGTAFAAETAPAAPADLRARAKLALRAGPESWPQALALFDSAQRQGDAASAYYLGLMLKNGQGAPRDSAAAARHLAYAAEHKVAAAMFVLANMLAEGEGVRRDMTAARSWIDRADALDYPEAALAKAIGLRDGSMGFTPDAAQAEEQMKAAAHAMQHRPAEP